MKDRKNIVIIILVGIIVLLSCIIVNLLIGNDIDKNNITNKNLVNNVIENNEIKIVESSYVAEEYEKEYINTTSVEFNKNFCNNSELEDLLRFSIIDNKLNVENIDKGETYISNDLINIKYLLHISLGTGCGQDQLILLTNDGKLYETESYFNTKIDDINKIDDMFRLVELPIIVSEIGIIKDLGPATDQVLLIKDNEGNQYHFWGNDLAKLK